MISTSTANLNTCEWCGCIHSGKCPQVKAIQYHKDGTVKRVEFFAPNDYVAPVVVKPFEPSQPRVGVTLTPFRWDTGTAGTSAIPISGISASISNTEGANTTGSGADMNSPYFAGYTLTSG